jgi:hypothetical protein
MYPRNAWLASRDAESQITAYGMGLSYPSKLAERRLKRSTFTQLRFLSRSASNNRPVSTVMASSCRASAARLS